MASSTGGAAPTSLAVENAAPPLATNMEVRMDARLLAAACSGSFQDLKSLLIGQTASSNGTNGSPAMQAPSPSGDEEAFLRESILYAVTAGGDTLLHVISANCECEDGLCKAGLIHSMAPNLLFVQNKKGDTPLHCAARAAESRLVSFLIMLARGEDDNANKVKELLEMENKNKWTILHEAVRRENNDLVKLLMEENPHLSSLPKDGTSPLYLAILLENRIIAETIYTESNGIISYSGPNGQNALHAAVLRGKDLTKMLLEWNVNLTIQHDDKGNTPLHFVTSMQRQRDQRMFASNQSECIVSTVCLCLLQANQDALYLPDHNGSFPIHVAASFNARWAIRYFIEKSSNCANLRDARGRTFLHVAVDNRNIGIVGYACRNKSLSRIMNMQDNDGNSALHLAVQAGSLRMFCSLFENVEVHLSLTNNKGETPLDIARRNKPEGPLGQNNETKICNTLRNVGAKCGFFPLDYVEGNNTAETRKCQIQKIENMKEATQNLCIGSVLVATVTFGATFAMPGGYRADDHRYGGTPTLAGRYTFDAFTLANALAFACSVIATTALMFSGSPMRNPRSRVMHLRTGEYFMANSVTSLVVAFALGTYVMLARVAHKSAIAACILSSLVLIYKRLEAAIKLTIVTLAVYRRKALYGGVVLTFPLAAFTFVGTILYQLWPMVIIFSLAALNHTGGKVEPVAQAPTPC